MKPVFFWDETYRQLYSDIIDGNIIDSEIGDSEIDDSDIIGNDIDDSNDDSASNINASARMKPVQWNASDIDDKNYDSAGDINGNRFHLVAGRKPLCHKCATDVTHWPAPLMTLLAQRYHHVAQPSAPLTLHVQWCNVC